MVVGLGVEVGELGVHNKTKQLHDDLFPKKEVEKKKFDDLQLLVEKLTVINMSALQQSGRFLEIIGWDPSVYKSNHLHPNIL